MIISAIRRAIDYCKANDTVTSATVKAEETVPKEKQKKADVHESDIDTDALESKLKGSVIAAFGSAEAAFDAHCKDGVVGRKEWKRLLKRVLPSLKQGHAKVLRKKLPNRMSAHDFCAFIGRAEDTESNTDKPKADKNKETESSGLASLPPEVPE